MHRKCTIETIQQNLEATNTATVANVVLVRAQEGYSAHDTSYGELGTTRNEIGLSMHLET